MWFTELNPAVMTGVQIYITAFVYFCSEWSALHLFACQSVIIYKKNHIYFVIVINIINIIQAKIISYVTIANKEGCFILATERNAQLFHTAARTIIWEFRNWVTFKLWTLNCILKLGLKLSALENEIICGV